MYYCHLITIIVVIADKEHATLFALCIYTQTWYSPMLSNREHIVTCISVNLIQTGNLMNKPNEYIGFSIAEKNTIYFDTLIKIKQHWCTVPSIYT